MLRCARKRARCVCVRSCVCVCVCVCCLLLAERFGALMRNAHVCPPHARMHRRLLWRTALVLRTRSIRSVHVRIARLAGKGDCARTHRKWDDASHAISAMDDGVAQIEPSVAHLLSASQVHARRCERSQA